MSLKATPTVIPDVLIIEPKIYEDERGFFFESYNERDLNAVIGRSVKFVQDNHSKSKIGVLRGLHYQIHNPQAKLVRVVQGTIYDVAVDLREYSATFGKWISQELSAESKKQLWIPEGFAHGFLAVTEYAEVLYKTTDYRNPSAERTLLWSDPWLGISWPEQKKFILSEKDLLGNTWQKTEKYGRTT